MDANQKHPEINEYAESTIRVKARQLIGTAGFTRSDVEDVEQEMRLELLLRLPKFDPARASYNTFVNCVTERKCAKLIRHRRQEMRDYQRRSCSLDDRVEGAYGGTVARAETVDQDELDIRTDKRGRSREEQNQLRTDVSFALSKLPDDLRRIAECVMGTRTLVEAARQLGMQRTTFYKALGRLQAHFKSAGLNDYFGRFPTHRQPAGYVTQCGE